MEKLKTILRRIDGKGYKAYQDIKGCYSFPEYVLSVDAVQGDPFASPSKIRVIIERKRTVFKDDDWTNSRARRIRCEDLIARAVHQALRKQTSVSQGTGKSGDIAIDAPGQEVLERTAVSITPENITICLSIGLPARGRRIMSKEAVEMFFDQLPAVMKQSMDAIQPTTIERAVQLADQQEAIRVYLNEHNLVAFVADGAILPRESGVSEKPLKQGTVIPFQSPKSLVHEITVPHRDAPLRGMGISRGITLIVGGGFHGKSTLLHALETGVYDHIEGDGREFVITDASAVKVRAEDGRSVKGVDISPFISNLPYGKATTHFSSENASGSTSQAANIMEAIEAGARTLLMDEDTCATNFMIRDARMQVLVVKTSEPITPFIDRARALFTDLGVSTILVIGGVGDYFDIADTVIKMENYRPEDVTDQAKAIAAASSQERKREGGEHFQQPKKRIPLPKSLNSQGGRKNTVKTRGKGTIQFGRDIIDLGAVTQLADPSQTRMIAECLRFLERKGWLSKNLSIPDLLDRIERKMHQDGLGSFAVFKGHPGELARPRRHEIAAAMNRMRALEIKR
ncbi:ABC-ATPase domain-containing protein [Camelliibacillus cellulosilyticus]|uniref:ABC-ATPase domain-containing protein n=1 Tax=Camelliibacillus cellulosilyticus TaxID=2174486 RepID=A0ABV9GSG6_9BACL